jgi:hypothetical protein
MHEVAPDAVPQWVQYVFVGATSLAIFVGTVFTYIKKAMPARPASEIAVVSAAFADREVAEKLHRSIEGLCAKLSSTTDEMQYLRRTINDDGRNRSDATRELAERLGRTSDELAGTRDALLNFASFITAQGRRDSSLRGGPHLAEEG